MNIKVTYKGTKYEDDLTELRLDVMVLLEKQVLPGGLRVKNGEMFLWIPEFEGGDLGKIESLGVQAVVTG
jgi:hypothetical protein